MKPINPEIVNAWATGDDLFIEADCDMCSCPNNTSTIPDSCINCSVFAESKDVTRYASLVNLEVINEDT